MINKRMLYSKQRYLIFCLIFVIFASIKYVNASEVFGVEQKVQKIKSFDEQYDNDVFDKILKSDFIKDELFKEKFKTFLDYTIKTREIYEKLPYFNENKYKIPKENKMLYLNFSLFFQDYLEDKYLDTKGKKLNLNNFIIQQQNMYNDIKKFIDITKDTKIVKYIYNNTSISENIINFIFAKKYLEENEQFGTTIGIKKSYTINEAKQPKKKIIFSFFDSNDNKQMSISTTRKPYGSQFGLILYEKDKDDAEIGKYFIKTHQNGNREDGYSSDIYTSKSLASAAAVNLKELFIYKLLEKIGIGPKVDFSVNPFSKNSLVISTESISNFIMGGKLCTGFGLYGDLFDNSTNEIDNDENVVRLKSDPGKQISLGLLNDLKSKFTGFDLLNRALCLNDVNEGNYGLIKDSNDEYFVKLVDFRAPEDREDGGYEIRQDSFLRSFLRANGFIYKEKSFIRSVLGKKTENEKITLAYKNLNIFDNITDELLCNTYKEIENFAIQNDETSNKQNAEIMGIEKVDLNSPSNNQSIFDLQQYRSDIRKNINLIKEIIKTKYNNLLENIKKDTQK